MIAADTNVVVRLLTSDDSEQFELARSLFAREEVWIAKTVLLETEWVLRSTYKYPAPAVYIAIQTLLAMETVLMEDDRQVRRAITPAESGLQFVDALHLCSRPEGAGFATFDRALVRDALRAGEKNIDRL